MTSLPLYAIIHLRNRSQILALDLADAIETARRIVASGFGIVERIVIGEFAVTNTQLWS
jgi:hypothetical protein